MSKLFLKKKFVILFSEKKKKIKNNNYRYYSLINDNKNIVLNVVKK